MCNGMVSFFSVDGLKEFATQFLNGELTPYVKSEPIPASNDGPVKVVELYIHQCYVSEVAHRCLCFSNYRIRHQDKEVTQTICCSTCV